MGSLERCIMLPFFTVLSTRIMENCYRRAWYSKLGAVKVFNYLIDVMPISWAEDHAFKIFAALMFVVRDLCDEVSFGAVSFASDCIKKFINLLITKSSKRLNKKILTELVREIVSASKLVRELSHTLLDEIAKQYEVTVVSLIKEQQEEKRDILAICPFISGKMLHRSIPVQIGMLEGTRYCLDLKPAPLMEFEWKKDSKESRDTQVFLQDVYKIMSGDEKYLSQACYKKWLERSEQGSNNSLKGITISAMKVMARCYYVDNELRLVFKLMLSTRSLIENYNPGLNLIGSLRHEVSINLKTILRISIFRALFQKMTMTSDPALMKAGEECLEVFLTCTKRSDEYAIPREEIHKELRPTLIKIGEYSTLNHMIVERLVVLSRLFQNTFNQKLCDTMMAHLKTALDKLIAESQNPTMPSQHINQQHVNHQSQDLIKMCAAICEFFPFIQQSNKNFLEELLVVIVEAENELLANDSIGYSLDLLHPYLTKFCAKMTTLNYRSVEIFLTEERLGKPGWHQLLMNILKEDSNDGKIIRKACESHTPKLIQIGLSHNISEVYQNQTLVTLQFRVVEIIYLLGRDSS